MKRILLSLFMVVVLLPVAHANIPPDDGNYNLIMLPLESGGLIVAKGDINTGNAWYRKGNKWIATQEAGSVPPSKYSFHAVAFKLKGWNMTRMDKNNGRTWMLIGNRWKEIRH